jgi:hypothetical protein
MAGSETCIVFVFIIAFSGVELSSADNQPNSNNLTAKRAKLAAAPLVRLPDPSSPRAALPCCAAPALLSCQAAQVPHPLHPAPQVDPAILAARGDILLPGSASVLTFSGTVPPRGHHYQGEQGEEAVVTWNPDTGAMFGSLRSGGRAFSLEHCGTGHAWLEYDVESFEKADNRSSHDFMVETVEHSLDSQPPTTAEDDTTMAEFSVMVYYTRQVAEITPDIPGFVDQVK